MLLVLLSGVGATVAALWIWHFTFGAEHRRPKPFGLTPPEIRFLRTHHSLVKLMASKQQAEAKAQNVQTREDAEELIEEVFDDEEDKEVFIRQLNTLLGVPGLSEETEAAVIQSVVDAAIRFYHARTSPATQAE